MRRSKHQGWHLYKHDLRKRNPSAKADACLNLAPGELIKFAQLSRDATAALEIEKSLREFSLSINKTQDAKRLQLGLRLHDCLSRSLVLIQPDQPACVPPLEDVRQIRTLSKLIYPTGTGMKIRN